MDLIKRERTRHCPKNLAWFKAESESNIVNSRVQKAIDAAIADGKCVGRPLFGYTAEDGFLQQIPAEYIRT